MFKVTISALAATLALGLAASAHAGDVQCHTCELYPTINSDQVQEHATLSSKVNVNVKNIDAASASATTVGNNLSVDGSNIGDVNVGQHFGGNAVAELNFNAVNVSGSADLSATAVANNVNITADKVGVINNTQVAYNDPSAVTNVNINNISDVTVASTAVANNLSVDSRIAAINSHQTSTWQPVTAVANVNVANTGNLTVSATAVGNNLNLKGL